MESTSASDEKYHNNFEILPYKVVNIRSLFNEFYVESTSASDEKYHNNFEILPYKVVNIRQVIKG